MTIADDLLTSLARRRGLSGSAAAGGEPSPESLAREVAADLGMDFVALEGRVIPADVLAALPADFALARGALPYTRDHGCLGVAVADPLATDVIDALPGMTDGPVKVALALESDLQRALERAYRTGLTEHPWTPAPAGAAEAAAAETDSAGDAPVVRLVRDLIADAIAQRASDIHLEPWEKRFRVRHRIDGVLREADAPDKRLQLPVISRLKILANLSIAEKRLPQDGRMRLDLNGRALDLRVSSLPTVHGESIVMRVLDQRQLRVGLPELGLLPDDRDIFSRQIAAPDGMVLVTGPTGSGKTTTLYASLHHLNHPDRKIITVEEPVEYQLPGINQVPVNTVTGMTFASALRAMLRQAPNVVMVGEIRDRETAEVAVNAALTGHLVFSTLHTNDAPAAITRLLDIGVKPFLAAAAVRSVVAQRLVRKVCARCRTAYRPSVRELHAAGLTAAQAAGAEFAHGAGCAACQGTGYSGRLGLFEIFLVHDGIRTMIYDHVTALRLRQQARRDGMRTMREDGIRKVLAGLTTIEEVVSATAADQF